MVLFPNCKINLGLRITAKRPDGFHDLETIFFPVPLKDVIEVVPSDAFHFHSYGLPIPGEPDTNLCVRAYQLLKQDFAELPPVDMHLYKQIPLGAGLGGGSADGTFMLKALREKFQLPVGDAQMMDYAARLGSDCPFFLVNKPCYATGRGERLEPLDLDLSGHTLVFVHPGIHIKTSWAFAQLKPAKPERSLREVIARPIGDWKTSLTNDFEKPVTEHFPKLAGIKEQLYSAGALYASMTGSGSSFFGIFPKGKTPVFTSDKNFKVNSVALNS